MQHKSMLGSKTVTR